ncbi:MAG: PepSY domain-containing protein [Steroidobacteraceae bacterium]
MNVPSDALRSPQRLYARIWRWHFFAALIVIPFVLWQSVTGVLYLWHREIAALAYPELVRVIPDSRAATVESQLAATLAHHPREHLQSIVVPNDPAASTTFFFEDSNALPYPAFTNPHTGEYLGYVASTRWIQGLSRGLHGGWPIKPWGSYLLELGACWAIVMILTGLYLWWPRNAQGLAGVLYPRLRNGSRTFWRDLHATVGMYFAVIVLAFLFSALPWTTFWGEKVLGPIERATNQSSPVGFFFAGAHHDPANEHAHDVDSANALTLDQIIVKAREAGARGAIEIKPALHGGPVNLRDDQARTSDEVWMRLDGRSGAVLMRATWDDYPPLAKAISSGIDLHEGHFFGRINQIFNTIVAVALVWLTVTGFMGWYKRRPSGGLAAPPKRDLVLPPAVIATGLALCVVMPLFTLSLFAIEVLDRAFGRLLPQTA